MTNKAKSMRRGMLACILAMAALLCVGTMAFAEDMPAQDDEQSTPQELPTSSDDEQQDELAQSVDENPDANEPDSELIQDIDEPEAPASEPVEDAEPTEEGSPVKADEQIEPEATSQNCSVMYRAHVQTFGWMAWQKDGAQVGTTGKAKRVEALNIKVVDENGRQVNGITYKAHVQKVGWTGWVSDGAQIGTTGMGRRVEALKIKLTGDLAQRYDVQYRVHIQSYGWLGWAKNGEPAGSSGYGKRIEGVEIKLVPKDAAAAEATGGRAYIDGAAVVLNAHVQKIGWQGERAENVGTAGRALRMEAITAKLNGCVDYSGGIVYQAHVQSIGWQGKVSTGAVAGTTGRAKRVEAFNFQLTGEVAQHYDVYYRAHVQSIGWMGWAKNGENVGTSGYARRMEALQVKLVAKGAGAPSSSGSAVSAAYLAPTSVNYDSSVDGNAWQGTRTNGAASGNTSGQALDQVKATLGIASGSVAGGISYAVRTKGGSWGATQSNGAVAGTAGTDIDAVRFSLTGEAAKVYNVYYCVHVPGKGWLAWAKNGEEAGTSGYGQGIDAYKVLLVARFNAAPSDAGASSFFPTYSKDHRQTVIDKYLSTAIAIANDNSHGYSRLNRWGPDYDCSSLVITALKSAGLQVGKATYTGNMLEGLTSNGWSVMRFSSMAQLQRGDILLTPNEHTEFYLGNGKNVRAWMSEYGSIWGAAGDQNGHEIEVVNFHMNAPYGWTYVLRLK